VGRRCRLAAAGNHLIEWTALAKMRVEFATKFTRPAGPSIETADDGMVNVFHEELLLGRRTDSPGYEAESQYSACVIDRLLVGSLYYIRRELYKPLLVGADLAGNCEPRAASCG